MKSLLIVLIISFCCLAKTFGQTTIIPETISTDEVSSQTVTIDPENIVPDETIPNELSIAPVIVRDSDEKTSTSDVPQQQQPTTVFHPQQEQATDLQQQQQQQQQQLQQQHYQQQQQQNYPLQPQWNVQRVDRMNHFKVPIKSMPTGVQHVSYKMAGHNRHHSQLPHRSIKFTYPYHSYVPQQQTQSVTQSRSITQTNGCQGTTKRDVEKSESIKNFESWYLNTANHDVLFSVCGTLLPGHRILIESGSPEFAAWIQRRLDGGKIIENEPILIQSINDLIHNDNIDDVTNEQKNQCPNEELVAAFKIFLRYFYSGSTAFDSIDDLDVSLFVLQMTREFLGEKIAERIVEPKIIQSMKIDSLNSVYRFVKNNKLDSLKLKWSKFIADHSSIYENHLPFSCDEIINDVELFDQFLQSLNTTQAQVIGFIRHYLQNCPESIHEVIKDASSLPNSLYFFPLYDR
ncbi:uncharacterized protein LOC113797403 [Dermatophagoides pteronyssinus]|uniref:uncharacterized protein LOC113797403 n=1 Tax=Dermatophagoides pteronyssinus TaxID=6956 RepID=UPI003F663143